MKVEPATPKHFKNGLTYQWLAFGVNNQYLYESFYKVHRQEDKAHHVKDGIVYFNYKSVSYPLEKMFVINWD